MLHIYNRYIPLKGFACIYLFGLLFVRTDAVLTPYALNHERIHAAQAREMLYIFFYLWYVIEWLCRSVQYRSIKKGYCNISFEREAYENMYDLDYLDWRNHYAWL